MNRRILFLLVSATTAALTLPSLPAAGTARENARLQAGKITKNEAQHLVLKQYPGATISHVTLNRGKGHGIWSMDVVRPGNGKAIKMQVDGRTGKILP